MKKIMKKLIKRIIPYSFRRYVKQLYRKIVSIILHTKRKEYRYIRKKQEALRDDLRLVQRKRKIRVAFFVIHESVWQYDSIFSLMKHGDIFEPLIILVPFMSYGDKTMLLEMNNAFNSFTKKGYTVVKAYDEKQDTWIDIEKSIMPDIIFFTNPHMITREEYYIKYWYDKALTYYVPYGIMTTNQIKEQYNQFFHNTIFRYFVETSIHKRMSVKYSDSKGVNTIVAGYPKCDVFLDKTYTPDNIWKSTERNLKKIIWAPHHTIENDDKYLAYSCFLIYHDLFFKIAEKYSDKLQIAFKPHPLLKVKLYKHSEWGIEKTDAYYKKWDVIDNGQCEEGDYIDLFMTSDAMILDSISFISEYSYLRKPLLFTNRDKTISHKFNDFGLEVYKSLYHSYTENGIINFIEDTVLHNIDPMKTHRDYFFSKYLDMSTNTSASRKILDIVREDVLNDYSSNNKAR